MVRRLLLDTSSLMYRAFFALPTSITSPDGRAMNAVHGYLDWTARLIGAREPGEVIHVFDADWRPAPRVAVYEGYKSTRAEDPEDLPPQFGVLAEVLDALGMPAAEASGWEAEDAIGSLIARSPAGDRNEIVTGDRDLIQLVRDPHVKVLFTRKGVSELDVLDEAAILQTYGVPAGRYADFAILRGDPSDALPGVRGVGQKTARELVAAYPSLEALVADATADRRTGRILQRSPSLRARVADAADYLAKMRDVVPIRTDLDVEIHSGRRDEALEDRLAREHGLGGPLGRLRAALDRPT